jgi:transcriptional regulator with XRE-family HTH domain
MKLELNKVYRARNGTEWKVVCISYDAVHNPDVNNPPIIAINKEQDKSSRWYLEGNYSSDKEKDKYDLIELVGEEFTPVKDAEKMKLLTNIEKLLSLKGWSQADLAKITGLTPAAISQFLSGERDPSLSSLIKLAQAFQVKIDDLINTDLIKLREFKFVGYLSELENNDPGRRYAIDVSLNKSCSTFYTKKEFAGTCFEKISKWEVVMKELPND